MYFGIGCILIFIGIQLIYSKKELKKSKRALEATYYYCDLEDKILEMFEDPFTTGKDWKEILPVCEYAEKLWLETHPYINPKHTNLVEKVKEIMA